MADTTPPTPASADTLIAELNKNITHYKKYARSNYRTAYIVTGIAVLASVSTTIAVAAGIGKDHNVVISILAAVPAVILVVTSTFQFEQKSSWHWRKTRALQALLRQLEYEGKNVAEVSENLSKVEMDLDKDWVTFGRVSGGDSGD